MNRRNFFQLSAAVLLGGTIGYKPVESEATLTLVPSRTYKWSTEGVDRTFMPLEHGSEQVMGRERMAQAIKNHMICVLEELSEA